MAHTKSAGTSRLGRDSNPKYLGVKLFDGQLAKPGYILVRQRGGKIRPGQNVAFGNDYTIYALKEGKVKFSTKTIIRFNGQRKKVKIVNVRPLEQIPEK